jgi:hypothetical protein
VLGVLQEGHACQFLFTWFSAKGLAFSLWCLWFRLTGRWLLLIDLAQGLGLSVYGLGVSILVHYFGFRLMRECLLLVLGLGFRV